MNRHERMHAALSGQNIDRVPVSAWGHFFDRENTAEGLAESMISFQKTYDWDFMKINCRGSYHAEAWGATYHQSGKPGERPVCTSHPLHSLEDWARIKRVAPDFGSLGEQLRAVELIRKEVGEEVPILMTVFSPLMIACFLYNLRSDFQNLPETVSAIKRDLAEDPTAVHDALSAISQTFADFGRALADSGVDGIYFATNVSSDSFFSDEEYRDLSRKYDLMVLQSVDTLPFNMLHLCGDKVHLADAADYPVAAIHWDTTAEGNVSLADGKNTVTQAVAGGVNRWTFSEGTPQEIQAQVREAVRETEGERFLLAPSCAVSMTASPKENLQAFRTAVEEI